MIKTKAFYLIKNFHKSKDGIDYKSQLLNFELKKLKNILLKFKKDRELISMLKSFMVWKHTTNLHVETASSFIKEDKIRNSRLPSLSTNDDCYKHLEEKVKEINKIRLKNAKIES